MRRYLPLLLIAFSVWAGDTGRTAPPFTMLRVNQPSIHLSQYRGKVVVLAFILTTCANCQQFTVELNQVAHDYARHGVQFVECAINEELAQTLVDFQERFSPPYPLTFSSPAAVSVFFQRTVFDQTPLQVPYVVLIDRAGVIRAEFPGGSEFFRNSGPNLRAHLDRMLGGQK
jgi:peroxiredoxin